MDITKLQEILSETDQHINLSFLQEDGVLRVYANGEKIDVDGHFVEVWVKPTHTPRVVKMQKGKFRGKMSSIKSSDKPMTREEIEKEYKGNTIGSYASFKGKLKVGDRVGVGKERLLETVLSVGDIEFETTCSGSGGGRKQSWTWDYEGATLELLTPSPRVVTLDDLQPGDEIESGVRGIRRTVVDTTKQRGFVITTDTYTDKAPEDVMEDSDNIEIFTLEELKSRGYVPVQPSPSPVETEEEWWENGFELEFAGFTGDAFSSHKAFVSKIVAEAERRTWEAAKKKIESSEMSICRSEELTWGDVDTALKLFKRAVSGAFEAKIKSLSREGEGKKKV